MFTQAVYTPLSMSDFLKDKPWRWLEVGDVDETVWDQLRSYIPSARATTSGQTTETPQPVPSAGATTPGIAKEKPAPSPSQLGKALFNQILKTH